MFFHATSLSQSAVYIYNSESLPKAQAECAYSFGPRSLGPGPWPWGPTWYAAAEGFSDKTGAQRCDLSASGGKTLICR